MNSRALVLATMAAACTPILAQDQQAPTFQAAINYVGTSAFNSVLDRIVQENSSYYVIGYYSTNDAADGKFRNNLITLSRDRLKAFHRPGYFAPR